MEKENQQQNILSKINFILLLFIFYDVLVIVGSFAATLWIRFDCRVRKIPKEYSEWYFKSIIPYIVLCIIIYALFKLYNTVWRFAGYIELFNLIISNAICNIIYIGVTLLIHWRMPISYYLFGTILQFLFTSLIRFSYRLYLLIRGRYDYSNSSKSIMIIGAGTAGRMIARDISNRSEINEKVLCFIDDNPAVKKHFIDGILVYGGRNSILDAVKKFDIDKIYFAIPSATAEQKRNILEICDNTSCEIMSLPGIHQLYTGKVTVSKMKQVAVEDLLGRDPIKTDMTKVFQYIEGKIVLITGGGGSIGSEICRQVAEHNPKTLIIFDIYENNAYDIQLELKKKYPDLDLHAIIGSVRDSRMIFKVFDTYRPEIVYHAAAHKHVPLMEDSPCEAIKNNVIGTYKTAYAAMTHGCKRFVLISTDKAVNPTNIMGASKRLCEMVIQSFDFKIKEGKAYELPQLFTHTMEKEVKEKVVEQLHCTTTEFVAVRFGNVLGSNGSVIPLFKKQIAQGGPVTVTHPDIIRYFMTIPEAVSLVLLAGTNARGGEIFVLDMGEPVKIVTLAKNLIRLSGYKLGEDIDIEYTGLRPGEKLYEEKLMAEEGLKKTENDLIHIGCPIPFDVDEFLKQLETLMFLAYENKSNIREKVAEIVTTYRIQ
ncbi:MAG: nucleoside-diphosphate sugar epimerase/dehydratase [Eubacteriales bacterium]|nr:nucleoside-diphosphate sugar epimerase/dehydratase [Eubacteriales bacterium]